MAGVGDGDEIEQGGNGFVYNRPVDAAAVQKTLVSIEPKQNPVRSLEHWQESSQNGGPCAQRGRIALDVFIVEAQQLFLETV